jgi:hypothetical protein
LFNNSILISPLEDSIIYDENVKVGKFIAGIDEAGIALLRLS